MSKVGDILKAKDFDFKVQIYDTIAQEWLDFAIFKEKSGAEDFIKYHRIKHICAESNLNIDELWRIVEL